MNAIQSLKSEYGIVKRRHPSMSAEVTAEAGESEFILLLLLNEVPGTRLERPTPLVTSTSLRFQRNPDKRMIIFFDDPANDIDFVTLHNILYFIYIGCVNIPFMMEGRKRPLPQGYPKEVDPFKLFRLADMFRMPELKEICFLALEMDMTPHNVTKILFHPACASYKELKELCFQYLIANYDNVKETKEWEELVCGDDEDLSPSVATYRARLLFKVSKEVNAPKK